VGDIEGMSRAAIALLRDEAKWQAASTLAASDARERFSLDQVVAQYEAFYEDALRGTVRADDASMNLTSAPLP